MQSDDTLKGACPQIKVDGLMLDLLAKFDIAPDQLFDIFLATLKLAGGD
jgi:hypothetical protein